VQRVSKHSKSIITFALSILIIFPTVAHGEIAPIFDADAGWTTPLSSQTPGNMAALFIDNSHLSRPGVSYLVHSGLNPGASSIDPTCTSTSDAKCNFSSYSFLATIPTCISATDVNCLSEVGAIDTTGKKTVGSFSRYLPDKAQNEYVGNPSWNLPSGTGASLFTIPGVDNPAGNSYLVAVSMGGSGSRVSGNEGIRLNEFSASIVPVQLLNVSDLFAGTGCELTPRICNPGVLRLVRPDGTVTWGLSGGTGGAGKYSCAGISWGENICAQKQVFPANYRFYVKVRLSLMPTGWMHGRISEPNIDIATSGKVSELTVTAAPIKVPAVYKGYLWNEMPPALQNLYYPTSGQYKGGNWSYSQRLLSATDALDPLLRSMTSSPPASENNAMDELMAWLPFVNDKATAMPSYWSVRSLSDSELKSANSCFKNPTQLNGIVTTNSTQYSAGPPEFNKNEGFLNYKVASPHFTSNGEVFKGSYDLAMRSDVARCIYGFSKAPVSATVSIVSSDGAPQFASTIFKEADGWVYLSAKNFEYSSPTLKVKLQQDTPVVVAQAEVKVSARKKIITISCSKGKVVKKISGISPKCPLGYAKK
jgi:hypothetical protein